MLSNKTDMNDYYENFQLFYKVWKYPFWFSRSSIVSTSHGGEAFWIYGINALGEDKTFTRELKPINKRMDDILNVVGYTF